MTVLEETGYEVSGLKPDEVKFKQEFFEKQLKLKFLADESGSDSDYGKEILRKLEPSGEELIEDYEKNSGIKPMRNGGKNDYIQAILQCFVPID